MAKKISSKDRVENKTNLITLCIACVVLLCVLVTGVVLFYTKAQNDSNRSISWQNAYARYFGGDGENALEILNRDYDIGLDERVDFGKTVSVIEGTQDAEGFEWGIWLNDVRITDRPADQIDTKNGDIIIWRIVKINGTDDDTED